MPDDILFVPRNTTPTADDINFLHYTRGGVNKCLLVGETSVLPNCVGYAWGRWRELLKADPYLSRGNAENWFGYKDGYTRGQTPELGAIACWRKGEAGVSKDGAGHVSVVEDVLFDGTIITSNSSYLGTRFYMRTIKPPYNIGTAFTFQGFIYPPVEFKVDNNVQFAKSYDVIAREVLNGLWGNGADRKARLHNAGYNPSKVQEMVNALLGAGMVVPKKTVDQIAQEVILGKWGTDIERKLELLKAGYDPVAVQLRVNQLLAISKPKKSLTTIAKEVIAGKWGSGIARKKALVNAGYDYTAVQKMVNRLLK